MPGPIGMGNHPKAMWPGVKAWYGIGYGEHPAEYGDLFTREASSQAWEEDVQTAGFPLAPVKPFGSGTTYAGHSQLYVSRYTHVAYSLGFIVTYEELMNNLYPKLARSRAKSLGFSMRQTKETVGANVYNRMFNSGYTGGDGSALGVTTHGSGVGNQSNILATAADLSESAIEDLIVQIMDCQNYDGLAIALMAQSLHVPTASWFEANRILKSTLQVHTGDNTVNVLKSTNALPGGIKVNHYFSDSDAWMIRTNCPDGMKHYQRHKYNLRRDNDFDTDNAKAKSYDYYSFGWSDWRGVFGSAGA